MLDRASLIILFNAGGENLSGKDNMSIDQSPNSREKYLEPNHFGIQDIITIENNKPKIHSFLY